MLRLEKIVSGGQKGADRAALDVAIQFGIPHGGWIPKGRKTEDGHLPTKYQLQEMATAEYPKRTEQNVKDSDGTLIIPMESYQAAQTSQKSWLRSIESLGFILMPVSI